MSLDNWLSRLSYTEFPDSLFRRESEVGARPYASEIEEMLSDDRGIGASAVFCVEDVPTICFIDAKTFHGKVEDRVESIRQKVWNQNLVSIVLVCDDDVLTAYSVTAREAPADAIEAAETNTQGRWSAHEVQSGFVKDRLSNWFSPNARVDQQLLANLRQVVKALSKDGVSEAAAEALMAQVIFLCYLEQRGIVGEAYRQKHGLKPLDAYVSQRDGNGIDKLLKRLGSDFNGDFLSSSDGGAPPWSTLPSASFRTIGMFLDAVDYETGQGSFWRYDFSHIPVELISGIYETLLKDRQGALGAYYTPRHLANLVAEEAFEGLQNPAELTVYDGACGSGILLTTAFRKMLRHAEVKRRRPLRFQERVALMQGAIFGNDLDETACWITAFSLYLCLLERLDPADISLLQTDANAKLPHLVGAGRNIQKGSMLGDFFSSKNPYAGQRKFDVFLCNPPWRESDDDEDPTWENWCRSQTPPYPIGRRQIAAGFAFRATQSVKAGGVIALILPLNLVIGASPQSCEFRRRWIEEAKVERITNFADVRRLLFPAAKHPCAVVRARPRPITEHAISLSDEVVEYWVPKTDVSLALGRLSLHAADKRAITSAEIYRNPYLLISAYWGEKRDLQLLRRLQSLGSLGSFINARPKPWLTGKGFHAPNQSNPNRSLGPLEPLKFLRADRLPHNHPVIAADTPLERVKDNYPFVASPGGKNAQLYKGPRVILPDGLGEDFGLRAVYTARTFAFTSSIGAIGGPKSDAGLLKFLAAYLRSPLATYLLIMTGYSVIAERPRVAIEDLKNFPFCDPADHPDPKVAAKAISGAGQILDDLALVPEWQRDDAFARVHGELNNHVFNYFQLSESERLLVNELGGVVAASIQPADYSRISTQLLHRPSKDELETFVEVLAEALNEWRIRVGGKGALKVEAVVGSAHAFFGAVKVSRSRRGGDTATSVQSQSAFSLLMNDIHAGLAKELRQSSPLDLFKIPNVMVSVGDAFYFVKPMRRRFWLARTALADADRVALTVQEAAWKRGGK